MDQIQEIKNRLAIEDVIGSYVDLKKAGRNFKACCPFHGEKTPSFVVSPEKQIAHCFGCHWGGDMFKFVQEYEKVEFVDALEALAKRAGVKLERTKGSDAKKGKKDRLKKLHEATAEFFTDQLEKNKEAREYLQKRNITQETIKEFSIGWAPDDYHETHLYLEKKGFSKTEIAEAGIASKKQMASDEIFDRFRGRVMFPIWDSLGEIVAFGGRTLKSDNDGAKYLNSPDTPIYNKGQFIYAFHKAKDAIRETEKVIVVEGYFDVIAAHQAGFKNVVGSLGTALTETQLKLLKRFAKEVIFSFDADKAGESATMRSIELAQELDTNIKILEVPEGKDPDECIQKDPKLWEKAVEERALYMDYILKSSREKHDPQTVEGKKNIAGIVLKSIAKIANAIEREHYLKKLGDMISASAKSLMEELKKLGTREQRSVKPESAPETKKHGYTTSDLVLSLIFADPKLLEGFKETLNENIFEAPTQKSLYKNIKSHYNPLDSESELEVYLEGEEKDMAKVLGLIGQEYYRGFSLAEKKKEMELLIKRLTRTQGKSRIGELKQELKIDKSNKKALEELNKLLKS